MVSLSIQKFTNAPGDWSCPICLEGDEPSNLLGHLFKSKSGYEAHLFHQTCIEEWIKKVNSCPICKRSFSKDRNVSQISLKAGLVTFLEESIRHFKPCLVAAVSFLGFTSFRYELCDWRPYSASVLVTPLVSSYMTPQREALPLTFTEEGIIAGGEGSSITRTLNSPLLTFALISLAFMYFAVAPCKRELNYIDFQIISFIMHLLVHSLFDKDILTNSQRDSSQNFLTTIYLTASFLSLSSSLFTD